MKKRVCSVLLAAVLCVTMLSVVALATESTNGNHTYTGNKYVANDNGINHSPKCDKCGYVDTSSSSQHCDNGSNSKYKDGKCDYCDAELAVSFNDSSRSSCATTLKAAFDYVKSENSSTETKLFSMKDIADTVSFEGSLATLNLAGNNLTGSITVNGGTLTITNTLDSQPSTVSTINVTGGTVKIEGNLTVTTLKISANAKVELSGGTYGKITGVTDKNTLLGPGYVFDGDTVKEAPIKSVTASVTDHNNAKYGYTAEQAPVLTATVAPDNATGVTYQWYKVNGSEKTEIDNATAQTYTVETGLNAGGYDYCCTATVDTYSLTSEEVKVTIAKADGPQLGTINVNQVYNDTASKTIEIYDQVIGKLNEAFPNGGTMEFQGDGYESADGLTLNGWQIDVNSGSITYTMGENTAPEKKITIKYKAFAHEGNYKNNYEYAEGTVVITLTKITPTGTPNYTPITSSGKTLADAHLNADNNAFSVPGTVKWAVDGDPESVKVEKGTAYEWIFRPDDYEHFEVIRGSIILWTESGSGVVIIVPSQSGESTPASNPNTGAAPVGQPLPGLALLALAALCLYAGTRRF
ncbi:MAG: hypothetical protein ACLU21_08930 [Angelakisella sp.]